jgi:hypothetical protein
MSACFCSGPAPGETFCPCQLRDISKLGTVRDSVVVYHHGPAGWKCPVCGKGNAPFQKLCANSACGIDFSKGATA